MRDYDAEMVTVAPGDVLAVRTGSLASRLIRLGAALRDKPDLDNHVVVAHHKDSQGVWWGVEGRPGGVGWATLSQYLSNPYTVTNMDQPRTDVQRAAIATLVAQMLGTPYDWRGIGADAATDLGLPTLFARNWHGNGTPGHVVCSSLAAYVYDKLGLPAPKGAGRRIQPSEWTEFILTKGWQS